MLILSDLTEKGTGTGSSVIAFLVLPEQTLPPDTLAAIPILCLHTASSLKGLAGFAGQSLGPSGVAFKGGQERWRDLLCMPRIIGWGAWLVMLSVQAQNTCRACGEGDDWNICLELLQFSQQCHWSIFSAWKMEPLKSIAKVWPHARCTRAGLGSNPEYPTYSWGIFCVSRCLVAVMQRYECAALAESF